MMKKYFALVLALAMSLSLAACGSSNNQETPAETSAAAETAAAETNAAETAAAETNAAETAAAETAAPVEAVTLKVAASPTPHAEILTSEIVTQLLAERGITLDVVEYSDYVVPNTSVDEGDNDCNYFQHTPYLDTFNEENGTALVSVGSIHYEPFGMYSNSISSVEEIGEGFTIAIPNDGSNEARALYMLQDLGLITLAGEEFNSSATVLDIAENPLNLNFQELEAAMVARTLDDVDAAIVNGNYALEAGLDVNTAIATESADTDAAQTYANIIATTPDKAEDASILALVEVLKSDEVQQWITENFNGAVLPVD